MSIKGIISKLRETFPEASARNTQETRVLLEDAGIENTRNIHSGIVNNAIERAQEAEEQKQMEKLMKSMAELDKTFSSTNDKKSHNHLLLEPNY